MFLDDVIVHERVHLRHPDVSDDDVIYAWHHKIKERKRPKTDPTQYAAVGFDSHGRLLEMCAVRNLDVDAMVVFHAMRATRKMMEELKLDKG